MRKVLHFLPLLALCLVLALLLPGRANAASESDLTFTLNSDGASYSVTDCDQVAAGELVIPAIYNGKPVTSIDSLAFSDCSRLTSVVIPDSVTWIGFGVFERCRNLTSVTFGSNFTRITDWMFDGCESLTEIVIPNGVTEIGYGAFNSCWRLSSITIPASLDYMGPGAFNSCIGLTDVYITDVSAWCKIDFNHELNDYSMPKYNTPMYYARKLHILDAQGNEKTQIVLDSTVTTIPVLAFKGCSGITSITIPDSVTDIGDGAFNTCTALQDVHYGGTEEQWEAIAVADYNAPLLNATLHCKIDYPFTYEIVDGEVTITGCEQSTAGELVIPATIEGYPVTRIGDNAFKEYKQLTSVVLPDGVTAIGDHAFYFCTKLKSVNIPNGVKTIGEWAFTGCYGLTSMTIPASVTSIGYGAFQYCSNLVDFSVDENNSAYANDEYGVLFDKEKTTLIQAPVALTGSYHIPESVTNIGGSAFHDCECLTEITIPDSVTTIGNNAFYECTGLQNIRIPANVTYIGSGAFALCHGITEIVLPEQITEIQFLTFGYCRNLKSVTIPENVTKIGASAFQGSTALQDVYYGGTKAQWDHISIGDATKNELLLNATLHCKDMELLNDGMIRVLEHTQVEELTVTVDQILDLNGHILTVNSLASFGQIIDSVGSGGLVVNNIEITSNAWLPIQDNTGCYRFYEYEVVNLGTKTGADSAIFGFALDFADATAYTALLESDDVQLTVTLAVGENSQTYAFSKELVAKYVDWVAKYPVLRPYMKLNVTGLDSVNDGTIITVTPGVAAVDGKLNSIGKSMEYIA